MEYDETKALRAKEVAERKFMEQDYAEANLFAKKARDLCPWLNSISILITVIDIYCAKEEVVNGQSGWHKVLKLEGSANVAKKCENFCSLVEIVQAGRNTVVGAEGALQILSEAFCNVTRSFWTKCSGCQYRFQYASFRAYTELVCINCSECFVAVPLSSGFHPTNQRTMSHFRRSDQDTTSVVLALNAIKSKGKRKKKDEGESSSKASEFEKDGMKL
ncbi:uncharacterized protein LOC112510497 [Cynara cardunculus var. scolymus]|uniref:uncharacterized protein LOC112510497 n=1 Tax=Cynara cardunculus var. scolymus TaxID=59895 RepID=UPI000D627143|nr:uncharacterized protein LOC112510497 [Cynara cardunculus var. scolymus]